MPSARRSKSAAKAPAKPAAKAAKKAPARRRKPPAKNADQVADQCSATTAKGARCRRKSAPGADRCPVHLGAPVGRPAKLTDDVVSKILEITEQGGFVETAAQAAGISRSTFQAWMDRGHPEGVRVGDGEDAPRRLRAEDQPYRDFREQIELARAKGEEANRQVIRQAAAKDWKAAAWLLERQYPERYGGALDRSRLNSGGSDPGDDDSGSEQRVMVGPDGAAL